MVNDPSRTMVNPFHGVYGEFEKILKNLVIKYTFLAEKYETLDSRLAGDQYVAAVRGVDTYFSYNDYTVSDFIEAGISFPLLNSCSVPNGYLNVPEFYRGPLLRIRRQRLLDTYEEQNDYYRELNGLPPLDTKIEDLIYLSENDYQKYGISERVPVHMIRDTYNRIKSGRGDTIMLNLERVGVLDSVANAHPEYPYLKHLASKRVPIEIARTAKNFQIISLQRLSGGFRDSLTKKFLETYESCRDYFVSAVFVHEYRSFIDHYDNLIGMCIMVMTLQNVVNSQLEDGIRRDYFNEYSLKMLYEAYDIPYDLSVDHQIQKRIAENLNLLLQQKATDRVLYNIAEILGFKNMNVYRYYLTKIHKEDIYGVPIIKMKESVNTSTGEVEIVPDVEAMYDVHFQRINLQESDFVTAFNSPSNTVSYESVVSDDPYWWEDEEMYKQVWETNYQFVESKYLGFGISYRMSEVMYSNIMLLRLLMDTENELSTIQFSLPKIDPNVNVTLFDCVILLYCLTAKKNGIRGEILTIPNQVDDVLQYMKSLDDPDGYAVDTFGFNVNMAQFRTDENKDLLDQVYAVLEKMSPGDSATLEALLDVDISPYSENFQKIEDLNKLYHNTNDLMAFLDLKMLTATDRRSYETLKRFYRALFYSAQTKSTFAIGSSESTWTGRRCAYSFFEFLRFHNPVLYDIFFTENWDEQYEAYIAANPELVDVYSMSQFKKDVEAGLVEDFYFGTLNPMSELTLSEDMLYSYISHIVSRIQMYVDGLDFFGVSNDNNSPLAELLVRLVRFFKSYTVDIVGMNTVYINDLHVENLLRFFDEPAHIIADIDQKAVLDLYDYLNALRGDINLLDTIKLKLDDRMWIALCTILLNRGNLLSFMTWLSLRADVDLSSVLDLYEYIESVRTDIKLPSESIDFYDRTWTKMSVIFTDRDIFLSLMDWIRFVANIDLDSSLSLYDFLDSTNVDVMLPKDSNTKFYDTLWSTCSSVYFDKHEMLTLMDKIDIRTIIMLDTGTTNLRMSDFSTIKNIILTKDTSFKPSDRPYLWYTNEYLAGTVDVDERALVAMDDRPGATTSHVTGPSSTLVCYDLVDAVSGKVSLSTSGVSFKDRLFISYT